ncbi:MAG: acylneuraminate cytidylyltransferase family protein [[Clostridium] fimetarium]|nr:acylneuraminate cytidylyltransferase family protein [Alistipes timonensis]MCM1405416.1 acylneuraminate cytidylyltransferase family protein [[Clostridium] fimetarium]
MTPLFIIPARGGSKGIPRKNIKLLAGRPLIAYTIDAAREACRRLGLTDRNILLSTDDEEIAAVAEGLGLPVPYRRPAALAADTSGSREVIIDAMDWAEARGIAFDTAVLLQPTSPFRTADDIAGCMDAFTPGETDMAVSVVETAANPYYNCFETAPDGYLRISKGDGLLTRRQDAPKAWEYNGAVYVINPESARRMPLGAFPRRVPYKMPRERSLDIDSPLDWAIAETVMGLQND